MFLNIWYKIPPRSKKFLLTILLSIVFGLAWFLLIFGRQYLDFTNTDWTYASGGDVFQHQIGWEWYRQESWHFPIGRIDAYGHPFGTTISYTDSILLFAIPFKLLSPLLTENFQYLGLWVLASVIGQLLIGMLIIDEFTDSYFYKISGASMLVLAPPLITWAIIHTSLSAQWILLTGIWFVILEYRHKLWRGAWLILFTVAMLVHLYFVAMLVPFWMISLYFRHKMREHKWGLTLDVYSVFGIMLLVGYCIGLFSVGVNNLAISGFGEYSWNLNGFINPYQFSSLFNSLPYTNQQFIGFSYLGLGNLVIIPIALGLFLYKERSSSSMFFILPFILVSIIFAVFALSNKAFFNTQLLWNFQLPTKIFMVFSLFRVSGRFIWPVFYLIVLFGLISLIRNFRYAAPFLLFALLIQVYDLRPLLSEYKFTEGEVYKSGLQSAFWHAAALTNQHIVLIPADISQYDYEPFALYARQNKLTLNIGYFARADYGEMQKYANQVWENLKVNQVDEKTIYIFLGPKWEERAVNSLSGHMLMCHVDGYLVALSSDNKLTDSNSEIVKNCSTPFGKHPKHSRALVFTLGFIETTL